MRTDLITSNYPVAPYVRTKNDALTIARDNQHEIVSYRKASTLPQAKEDENSLRRGVAFWDSSSGRRPMQVLPQRLRTSSRTELAIDAYRKAQENDIQLKSRLVDLYA